MTTDLKGGLASLSKSRGICLIGKTKDKGLVASQLTVYAGRRSCKLEAKQFSENEINLVFVPIASYVKPN